MCHWIKVLFWLSGLRRISLKRDKLIVSFNYLQLCWLTQCSVQPVLFFKVLFLTWRSGGLGFPTRGDLGRPCLGPEQCDWRVRLTSSVEVGPWRLITITRHGTDGMKPLLTTLMEHLKVSSFAFYLFLVFRSVSLSLKPLHANVNQTIISDT